MIYLQNRPLIAGDFMKVHGFMNKAETIKTYNSGH